MLEMAHKFKYQSLQYADDKETKKLFGKYQTKLHKIVRKNRLHKNQVLNTSSKIGKDIAQLAMDLENEACTLIRKGDLEHGVMI